MRLGEILVAAELVDARKLESALEYAASKSIPVGGALRALKYLSEQDLKRTLDAQQAIRKDLGGKLCIAALKHAHAKNCAFVTALKKVAAEMGMTVPQEVIYSLSSPDELETTQVGRPPALPPSMTSRPADKIALQADQFFEANQLGEAERTYQQALTAMDNTYGTPAHAIVAVLIKMANIALARQRYPDARKLYLRVLDLQSQSFGPNSAQVAKAQENLGEAYLLEQDESEARRCFNEALDLIEKFPEESAMAARLLKKLAPLVGDDAGARVRLGELAIDSKLLSEAQLQSALGKAEASQEPLGVVLRKDGVLTNEQMESLMFAQMLIREKTLPPRLVVRGLRIGKNCKITLRSLCEAGKWHADQVSNDPLYQQLVTEQERLLNTEGVLGPEDPEVAAIAMKIAEIHVSRKDPFAAEPLFKRIIATLEKVGEGERTQLVRAYDRLAQVYCQNQRFGDARPILVKSLELRRAMGKVETIETAKCLWLLGKIAVAQGQTPDALKYMKAAKGIFDKLAAGACPKQLDDDVAALTARVASLPSS